MDHGALGQAERRLVHHPTALAEMAGERREIVEHEQRHGLVRPQSAVDELAHDVALGTHGGRDIDGTVRDDADLDRADFEGARSRLDLRHGQIFRSLTWDAVAVAALERGGVHRLGQLDALRVAMAALGFEEQRAVLDRQGDLLFRHARELGGDDEAVLLVIEIDEGFAHVLDDRPTRRRLMLPNRRTCGARPSPVRTLKP